MAESSDFSVRDFQLTVRDFVGLIKELNEHEAEVKIKLAKAGVGEERPSEHDEHATD